MKIWQLFVGFIVSGLILYGLVALLIFQCAETVVHNGGLKNVSSQIWNGDSGVKK
jgi:hypothetical protein